MKRPKFLKILVVSFLLFTLPILALDKNSFKDTFTTTLDLKAVFLASPTIYSVLIGLSVTAVSIWIYCLMTFREKNNMTTQSVKDIKTYLLNREYEKAINYCNCQGHLFASIIASALNVRAHGPQFVAETMKSEGIRFSTRFWQKINFLHDISIISPMLGLLGTVTGIFYAFYDINRSMDSISHLFDGLGISIGCTVVGLVVAIMAMIFHATLKYRLVRMLNAVENEAFALCHLINPRIKKAAKEEEEC